MEHVAVKAKAVLGTYTYGWPELAQSTQDQRVKLGFSANEPGFRTGYMQASVETMAQPSAAGAEGLVYSGELEALWFELGTDTPQPPRSFLFKSLWLSTDIMDKEFAAFAERIIAKG